jgi:hypothetical protein
MFSSNHDFETVQSIYDTLSIYNPWKYYFIESKTVFVKNQNYIIQQYLQRSNFQFKSVHVVTAVDESNEFLEEILTEICEIGSRNK